MIIERFTFFIITILLDITINYYLFPFIRELFY